MEDIKRKHRKARSVAEIEAAIRELNEEKKRRQEKDQIEVGRGVQALTGLQTWQEIEPILAKALASPESGAAAEEGQEVG